MADSVAEQIAALKDEDWAIREEAATMLGTLRDPRAVVPLVSVLRDGDRAVRDAAIGALLAIGEPAVTTLGVCLSDPVLTVQELASSVLATIADARVLTPLMARRSRVPTGLCGCMRPRHWVGLKTLERWRRWCRCYRIK